MLTNLTRFQQQAVKHNLSSAAILLWQSLYFTMTVKNQFEKLQQDSSMLMNILQLSRQGLLHVRKMLVDAGLLAVELDDSQKLRYTLMLEGKVVQPVKEKAELDVNQPLSEEAQQALREPIAVPKSVNDDTIAAWEYVRNASKNKNANGNSDSVNDNANRGGTNYNALIDDMNDNANGSGTNYDAIIDNMNDNANGSGTNYNALINGVSDNANRGGTNYNALIDGVNDNAKRGGTNYNALIDGVDSNAHRGGTNDNDINNSRNNPATSGEVYQQDGLRSYEEGKAALYDSLLHGDTKRFSLTKLVQNSAAIFTDTMKRTGDIVMNCAYKNYVKAFGSRYNNNTLAMDLYGWLRMREQNGWTLTLWGLEELLKKLIRLAAGSMQEMAQIVKQSIKRRWKGFYPLSVQSQPSGEKLLKLEEQARKEEEKKNRDMPSGVRKCKNVYAGRDLSFLEE